MNKLIYGQTQESTFDKIDDDFNKMLLLFKYKKGDEPNLYVLNSKIFTPVLVINSDDFLDVEYKFILDNKIYTEDESLEILKKIKGLLK